MKIKIRPDHASLLEEEDWPPTDDWLAALRDDGRADPAGDGHAQRASSDPPPEARAEAAAPAQADARAEMTGRAVIGDQLRMPIMWCEMGSCISWHADPAALGEADTRARAIAVGWRIDALGRLACPRCQQTDPGFWATGPVLLWDRYTAIARAARAAVVCSDVTGGAAWRSSGDPGRAADGYPPTGPPEARWQQPAPPSPRRWS